MAEKKKAENVRNFSKMTEEAKKMRDNAKKSRASSKGGENTQKQEGGKNKSKRMVQKGGCGCAGTPMP